MSEPPIGFYITCDDAMCERCFKHMGGEEEWIRRGGFEGWQEPISIFEDKPSDTPTHCCECGAVIEHDLTEHGLGYVAEYIGQGFQEGRQNPVTVQWIRAYEEQLDDATMPQADGVKLADACALYELLPRDEQWVERDALRKHARLAGWTD